MAEGMLTASTPAYSSGLRRWTATMDDIFDCPFLGTSNVTYHVRPKMGAMAEAASGTVIVPTVGELTTAGWFSGSPGNAVSGSLGIVGLPWSTTRDVLVGHSSSGTVGKGFLVYAEAVGGDYQVKVQYIPNTTKHAGTQLVSLLTPTRICAGWSAFFSGTPRIIYSELNVTTGTQTERFNTSYPAMSGGWLPMGRHSLAYDSLTQAIDLWRDGSGVEGWKVFIAFPGGAAEYAAISQASVNTILSGAGASSARLVDVCSSGSDALLVIELPDVRQRVAWSLANHAVAWRSTLPATAGTLLSNADWPYTGSRLDSLGARIAPIVAVLGTGSELFLVDSRDGTISDPITGGSWGFKGDYVDITEFSVWTSNFSTEGTVLRLDYSGGGDTYPTTPTYPDPLPLPPESPEFAAVLRSSDLTAVVNKNALQLQALLATLMDKAEEGNPQLTIDLNGFSLLNLGASSEANAPARKS